MGRKTGISGIVLSVHSTEEHIAVRELRMWLIRSVLPECIIRPACAVSERPQEAAR